MSPPLRQRPAAPIVLARYRAAGLSDWFFKRGRRDGIDWMALDSRLDSSVSEAWSRLKDMWDAGSSFFARFKLTGGKRLLTEAASEGFTLAVGGFFVLYALALPDGRWDKMVYGIRDCEEFLRAVC